MPILPASLTLALSTFPISFFASEPVTRARPRRPITPPALPLLSARHQT
jgi:hypothetical protein